MRPANVAAITENFIRTHGRHGLKRFIKLIQQGESGQKIAQEFGVTRERVRQWRNAFGRLTISYEPDPLVLKIAGLR